MVFKHLFVDDTWIAETQSVHRCVGVPAKHPANPLIVPEYPWEEGGICLYGSVLADGGRFRMWYQVYGRGGAVGTGRETDPPFTGAVAYAESDDGITWRKPLTGLTVAPYGPTNLVMLGEAKGHLYAPSVIRDGADPDPARRYKMMVFDTMCDAPLAELGCPFPPTAAVPGWHPVAGEGLFVCASADGIAWRRLSEQPVIGDPCDASAMCRGADGHFRAYFKTSVDPTRHFRILAMSESRDFEAWEPSRIVLEPDWRDPPGTEFYGMAGFPYCGSFLGLLWIFRNAPGDKRLDIQLAASPDGRRWTRGAERRTFLATGPSDAWDCGTLVSAAEPVHANDGIRLYYGAANTVHNDMHGRETGIGLATLRPDGFAGMHAPHLPGTLLTAPVEVRGGGLFVNADARRGRFGVTVLDAEGETVLAESETIVATDASRIDVPLPSGALSPGRRVRLKFRLEKAALYAFWFEDVE